MSDLIQEQFLFGILSFNEFSDQLVGILLYPYVEWEAKLITNNQNRKNQKQIHNIK